MVDDAAQRLSELAAGVNNAGVVHTEMLTGPPGPALRRFAEQQDVDVLVVNAALHSATRRCNVLRVQEYLDLADIANEWGIEPATVRRYHHDGRLPEADAVIGRDRRRRRKYGWLPETIAAADRPGRGARTDLHRSS